MGHVDDWLKGKDDWIVDAFGRTLLTDHSEETVVEEVLKRAKANAGIVGRPTDYLSFKESSVDLEEQPERWKLAAIGPVKGIDRLKEDQRLCLALDGVTLVFGENGLGKSGYCRVAGTLCGPRIRPALRGNVYSASNAEKEISFAIVGSDGEAHELKWIEGSSAPKELQEKKFSSLM